MPKNIRKRDESESEEENEGIKERIEDLKFIQKLRVKPSGVDASVLAIGDSSNTENKLLKINNDPWKIKTGGLVDMKKIKENDVVNNMNSNFARETNQRDEDAEMQKFIEEQLKLKKTSKIEKESFKEPTEEKKIKRLDDVLFDVPKHLIVNQSKHKSEETLSEQMLSGIPEVDLGVGERIRNIEETERAKQQLVIGLNDTRFKSSSSTTITTTTVAETVSSVNFVQHKRFDETLINVDKKNKKIKVESKTPKCVEPVVGDTQKHELLKKDEESVKNKELKKPHNNRASDDYYLERFKRNMRGSRSTKIKIA